VLKPRVAILAAAAIAVLCLAAIVATAKHKPALSARVVTVETTTNALFLSVQLSNSGTYVYVTSPARIEIWNGRRWETWRELTSFMDVHDLPQHATKEFSYLLPCTPAELRPNERLRLVIGGLRPQHGLRSFSLRLQIWLHGGAASLNPFDPEVALCPDTAVTDEFKAP